jgi:photosystem II stability/assembly factor-like uncharacterized protein
MKPKISLAAAVCALLVAILACTPFKPLTTLPPATQQPLDTSLAPTLAEFPTQVPTPTSQDTVVPPTAIPQPTIQPQEAAPAHYHTGVNIQLDSITMTSLTEGWGISGRYLLVTVDGGKTWREVTPPVVSTAGGVVKIYGTFLDPQTAWVIFSVDNKIPSEASVWHTTDGGSTWTPGEPLLHQAFADTMWADLAAADANNAWVLISGVYVGAGTHFNNQLLHSVDGGITWTPYNGDVNWGYTGMVFWDASNGWLTWQQGGGAYGKLPPPYAVTSDGGASWEILELPPPPDAPGMFDQYSHCEAYQPNLLSSQSIRLLVGCFDDMEPPQKFISYLYTSENGGNTWSTYRLPDPVIAEKDTLIFFDASNALLLGRYIYRTTDGGHTWSPVQVVTWDGLFSFVDNQNGLAVVRSSEGVALVKTNDGGRTWIMIKPTTTR